MAKMRVGLLFGGCSGEHEVSIRSAQAIAKALSAAANAEKYEILPVHISKNGHWLMGEVAQQVLTAGTPLQLADPVAQERDRPVLATELDLRQSPLDRLPILNQAAAIDIWFPVLHGPNGEDGSLQGLLQLMQVPFVGSGVLGSALGMDKLAMKMAFAQAGLPQVSYGAVTRAEVRSDSGGSQLCDRIEAELGYPALLNPLI